MAILDRAKELEEAQGRDAECQIIEDAAKLLRKNEMTVRIRRPRR